MAEVLLSSYFNPEGSGADLASYKKGDKVIPYNIIAHYKGTDLVGMHYEQLLPMISPMEDGAFRVIQGDYVTTEDGTGIVHIAPNFGADDALVAKKAGVPPIVLVDKKGNQRPVVDLTGKYYVVDDLSLPRPGLLRKGRKTHYFFTFKEAIFIYQNLSSSCIKSMGIIDGRYELEIVRCVPLFKYDTEGENILASDHKQYPFWANRPEIDQAVQTCRKELRLRYLLYPDAIMPIPKSEQLPDEHSNLYLNLSSHCARDNAVRQVYIAGVGWVPPRKWKRRASRLPLILKFQVDGLTEDGVSVSLNIEPWEYDLLVRRTLERLNQNNSNTGGKNK